MFHILLGIVLIALGLMWSGMMVFGSLWEFKEAAAVTRQVALWGLVPIGFGILAIWFW